MTEKEYASEQRADGLWYADHFPDGIYVGVIPTTSNGFESHPNVYLKIANTFQVVVWNIFHQCYREKRVLWIPYSGEKLSLILIMEGHFDNFYMWSRYSFWAFVESEKRIRGLESRLQKLELQLDEMNDRPGRKGCGESWANICNVAKSKQ